MPKINSKSFLTLWLFNPLISAVYLFKNFKDNTGIAPYLMLSAFFGLCFVVSTGDADSARYAADLAKYHQDNLSFEEALVGFYSQENAKLDIYQPLVTWLVSIFTDNVHVLFAIFASVFGYFWFKSLIIIRSHITVPFSGLILICFLFLALTNPIWSINAARMWTAVGIFFYGILLYHLEGNKKGYIFLVLALFVHFSLVASLVLYVIYVLLPIKNKTVLLAIFLLTFYYGELNLEILREYFEKLPAFAQSKKTYLNDEYAEEVFSEVSQLAPHVVLAKAITKYSVVFMALTMYYYSVYKKKSVNAHFDVFFTMGIFFASFSNLAASVPSGSRFIILSNLILVTSFILFLNQRIKLLLPIKRLLSVSIIFVLIFNIREAFDYVGLFFFIGNPIANWFVVDSPFIEFIKSLI